MNDSLFSCLEIEEKEEPVVEEEEEPVVENVSTKQNKKQFETMELFMKEFIHSGIFELIHI